VPTTPYRWRLLQAIHAPSNVGIQDLTFKSLLRCEIQMKNKLVNLIVTLASFWIAAFFNNVHAQTSVESNCIQFNPNGNLDCSVTPSSVTPWEWYAGGYVNSIDARGPTELAAVQDWMRQYENYINSQGTSSVTGFCGVSIHSVSGQVKEQSIGFDFNRFVTNQRREGGNFVISICSTNGQGYFGYSQIALYTGAGRVADCAEPSTQASVYQTDSYGYPIKVVTLVCAQPLTKPNKKISPESCTASSTDGTQTPNPMIPATGERQLNETDYEDLAPHPLHWKRYYRSQFGVNATQTPKQTVGALWAHSDDYNLKFQAAAPILTTLLDGSWLQPNQPATGWTSTVSHINSVEISMPDGAVRVFRDSIASPYLWSTQGGAEKLTTVRNGNSIEEFRYVQADDAVIRFNVAGRHLSTTQRNGWTTHYAYDNIGRLTQITNHFGRSISLAYNNGLISQVNLPDATTIRYSYDTSGRLLQVIYPNNTTKQYLYENTAFPHLLTGVIDENGIRLSTYSYDAQGRAIETTKASGADRYQVSYGTSSGDLITSATITDPLGTPRTYNYATSLSQLAVTGADKPSGLGLNDAASRV
jgi:YD repeat-containing protein